MNIASRFCRGSWMLLLVALFFSGTAQAQDRRITPDRTVAPAELQAEPLRDFRELNTAVRGRGTLSEPGIQEYWVTRVSLNLKRNGDAEIEVEGENDPAPIRGRWAVGQGETINLTLTRYKNDAVSGTGRVMLNKGVFSRLEIMAIRGGASIAVRFDARTAPTAEELASRDPYEGRFVVQIVSSGHVLDLRNEDKRSVQQWSQSGANNQQWLIEKIEGDEYIIKSAANDEAISIDTRARDGITVFTSPYDKRKDSQRWLIKDAGDGQVYLVSLKGVALELPGGVRDLGTRLQLWRPGNTVNQKFRLLPVSQPLAAGNQPAPPVVPQGPPEGPGSMTWRGTVDGIMRLEISGATVTEKNVSGAPYTNSKSEFTASLPRRATFVSVSKQRGRGSVEVVQQPSDYNNFTAVIQVRDSEGGSNYYELTVSWR